MQGVSRRAYWAIGAAIVLIGILVGTYLYVRVTRANACHRWHGALAELTDSARSSVGSGTAEQFRLEAIRRGWIDEGGHKVFRPSGCTP
jgi:hypothetical protein